MAFWNNTSNHNLFYFHFDDLTKSGDKYYLTLKNNGQTYTQAKTVVYICQTEREQTPLAEPPQIEETRFTVAKQDNLSTVSHRVTLLSNDLTMQRNIQITYRHSNNLFDLTDFVNADQYNIQNEQTWCILLDKKTYTAENTNAEQTLKLYQFGNSDINNLNQLILSLSQLGVSGATNITIQDNNGVILDSSKYNINWGQDIVNIQFDPSVSITDNFRLSYYVKTYTSTQGDYVSGTWLKTNQSSNDRVNYIIDTLLNPSILEYRQIGIYHEPAIKLTKNRFKFTYQNWNQAEIQLFLNNNPVQLDSSMYSVNYEYGIINVNFDATDGDTLMCSYNFDYFPTHILEGFLHRAVSQINVGTVGTVTDYTLDTAPTAWDGIIADYAYVYCLDKLILDYDIWKGRLIFALPPQALADGSGDIISQLDSLRSNAMDRIRMTIQNPKFKAKEYLAAPTIWYYRGISPAGRSFGGLSGNSIVGGKLRGLRINRFGTGGF